MSPAPTLKPTESPLGFPFPKIPASGMPFEVAPGIYWVRMPLPFDLDHINLWLLKDGDDWTIVDCGYGSDQTRAAWEQVFAERLGDRMVKRVVVTHFHPDHIGLASWLTQRFSAEFFISLGDFLSAHAVRNELPGYDRPAFAELYHRHGVDDAHIPKLSARNELYHHGVPSLPARFRRLQDGHTLTINGHDWRVIMGYGHAPEHAALYCASRGVLISGDMILPNITTNVSVWGSEPDGNPLKQFLDSVAHYAELPEDTLVLPSHGRVFTGLRVRAAQLQHHHNERLAELRAAATVPRTAMELLPTLFRRPLDMNQTAFALGEAIAHLNYLWYAGVLQRTMDAGGVYRFTRV